MINKLKQIRKDKRISQSDVAYALGVTPFTLRRYEKGERMPPYWIVEDYAKYLDYQLLLIKL